MTTRYDSEWLLSVADQANSASKPIMADRLKRTVDYIAQLEAKLATSTLRDDFAKAAMQAYASDPAVRAGVAAYANVARWSYEQADAMLDARIATN